MSALSVDLYFDNFLNDCDNFPARSIGCLLKMLPNPISNDFLACPLEFLFMSFEFTSRRILSHPGSCAWINMWLITAPLSRSNLTLADQLSANFKIAPQCVHEQFSQREPVHSLSFGRRIFSWIFQVSVYEYFLGYFKFWSKIFSWIF